MPSGISLEALQASLGIPQTYTVGSGHYVHSICPKSERKKGPPKWALTY